MQKKSLISVSIILFAGIVVTVLVSMLLTSKPGEYYIFQNIEECERLLPSNSSDIQIERYKESSTDANSKGLLYRDFWGIRIESDTIEYELFAYEFNDFDLAKRYFANVTGKNEDMKLPVNEQGDCYTFSLSKGMFSYCIVVVCGNRAYKLTAPNKYADDINMLLASTFSQKIS